VSALSGARVKGGRRRSTRNGIITPTAKLRLEKLLHALSLSHAAGTLSARAAHQRSFALVPRAAAADYLSPVTRRRVDDDDDAGGGGGGGGQDMRLDNR